MERLEEGISGRKNWEGNVKKNANDGSKSEDSVGMRLEEAGSVQGNEKGRTGLGGELGQLSEA